MCRLLSLSHYANIFALRTIQGAAVVAMGLSRRERQIMDFLHRCRAATVAEVQAGIPNPPGYSSVRTLLRILEQRGHVRHRSDGARYVYEPVQPRTAARRTALRHLVKTFFDGSEVEAAAALLNLSGDGLDPEEAERLSKLIEQAKREGR
jgi:BlaI family transcriptional regulator, penicillinase repressor